MKIRRKRYPTGKIAWEVDYEMVLQEDGTRKRVQKFFPSQEKARGELETARLKREKHGADSLNLSEADRIRFTAARDQLATSGWTLDQAVALAIRTARALKYPHRFSACSSSISSFRSLYCRTAP